jgi:hypothetical protein
MEAPKLIWFVCCGLSQSVSFIVANAAKTDIGSLQIEELREKLRDLGQPNYRVGQISDWLYKKRVESFEKIRSPARTAWAVGGFAFDRLKWFVFSVRGYDPKISLRLGDEISSNPF